MVDLEKNENQDEEVVQVPSATYQAMLDELDDLGDQVKQLKEKGDEEGGDKDELDDLLGELDADEDDLGDKDKDKGKGKGKVDLQAEIDQGVAKAMHPILVKVLSMDISNQVSNLRTELKALDKEGKPGKDDWNDIKDEVLVVAKRFPNMTVKEAYTYYKGTPEAKARIAENLDKDKGGDRKALLKHLPRPYGERPGPGSGVEAGEEEGLEGKAAAAAAYDKVFGK